MPYYHPAAGRPANMTPGGRGLGPQETALLSKYQKTPGGWDYLAGLGAAPAGMALPDGQSRVHKAMFGGNPASGADRYMAWLGARQRFGPPKGGTPNPNTPNLGLHPTIPQSAASPAIQNSVMNALQVPMMPMASTDPSVNQALQTINQTAAPTGNPGMSPAGTATPGVTWNTGSGIPYWMFGGAGPLYNQKP